MTEDIYQHFIHKIRKSKKIAFLDIDLTLTGLPDMQIKVRKLLEKKGFTIVYVTSRPYELILSDEAHRKSKTLTRPLPKTEFHANGKRYHADLGTIPAFHGLLDPDAIASSTGLELYIRQSDGSYLKDETFNIFPFSSREWKSKINAVFKQISSKEIRFSIKKTEDIKNYHNHETDIAPIDYRFQIDFPTLDDKKNFIKKMNTLKNDVPVFFLDDSEGEINIYSIYVVPKKADNLKGEAVDFILNKINEKDLQVLVAGDSYPDLQMILYSAKNTKGLFYVSGRSRLTKCFTDISIKHYLDISVSNWKKNLKKKKPGIYTFLDRTIYIADELFPGTWGAESLYHFLQSSHV